MVTLSKVHARVYTRIPTFRWSHSRCSGSANLHVLLVAHIFILIPIIACEHVKVSFVADAHEGPEVCLLDEEVVPRRNHLAQALVNHQWHHLTLIGEGQSHYRDIHR